VFLSYPGKKEERDILEGTRRARLRSLSGKGARSRLIQGDNLAILNALLDSHRKSISLVYIDPPFATNTLFRIGATRANTISSSDEDPLAYSDKLLGAEFLEFLRERLVLLRELLSENGSIYLHIDYKIGHYVKILMDEIFGARNFRNDIARIKCNPKNFHRRAYGNVKDLILFYSRSKEPTWNEPTAAYSDEDMSRLFKKTDGAGRKYTTIPLHAPGETANGETGRAWRGLLPPKGRHWRSKPDVLEDWHARGLIEWSANGVPRKKIFADEASGKRAQDIWDFKDPQYPQYPTEKNLDLLKRIVSASSNPGDLVLDCFCGSGTTLIAAEQLRRSWIGVDASKQAIAVARKRLQDLNKTGVVEFEVMSDADGSLAAEDTEQASLGPIRMSA